jgi:hypothetical protein
MVPNAQQPKSAALAQAAAAASWFFWIAGITVVNTIIFHAGSNRAFMLGLGSGQISDAVGADLGSIGKIVSLVFDLIAVGTFVGLGILGGKGKRWALILGVVFYTIDTLIILASKEWLGLALHGYAIMRIWPGMAAQGNRT